MKMNVSFACCNSNLGCNFRDNDDQLKRAQISSGRTPAFTSAAHKTGRGGSLCYICLVSSGFLAAA